MCESINNKYQTIPIQLTGFRNWAPAAALLTVLLTSFRVEAHALYVECKLHGDRVELEAFYDDDTPARQAQIRVEDEQKRLVVEGRTDGEGRWSFAIPSPGRYWVEVDDGDGHRAETRLTIPSSDQPSVVSEGPTREEVTRFPWLKLILGVMLIGGLSVAFLLARRLGRTG